MKRLGTLSVGNWLKVTATKFPDKEAVADVGRDRRCTFRELNNRVNSLAHGLMETGAKKGDFVSMLFHNQLEIVETYFALAKIGAVAAPLPYRLAPRELKILIDHCEATTMVFGEGFTATIDALRPEIKTVGKYICAGKEIPQYATPYENLAVGYAITEPDVEISEDDPHYLNYTSGTTGLPKAFLISHYNSCMLPLQGGEWRLTDDDVALIAFPMYGRVALAWMINCIWSGATMVALDFEPNRWLETVEKEKVTICNLVPTMGWMILSVPDLDRYDLSSLRGIIFAGSSLPQSVLEETQSRICPNVYEYYGLQETSVITQLPANVKRRKPTSVGIPPPCVEMRIVDAEGKDVALGEMGEIVVKSTAGVAEYFKEPEKTRATIREGWFHTEDLGRQDEDGYVYLMGRTKDMIISGAQNIFAPEVEETILSCPKVADCAVIGLPDELWGEAVTAVVVPKAEEKLEEEELIQFCKDRMAHFKAPKSVKFIDVIPRNPAGKIMKFVLVEQYSPKK